ncbi:hypothetical protein [Nonomuraea longicatena]|uniref:Uncharacterized protein n=1 Tax=Nonomuraea longicatena TaxID=83682 RepID=A0ABP4A6D5_9ACTN
MEPRFDLMNNNLGAKIAKRIYNVALAIVDSPLPQATQNLVMLRASQGSFPLNVDTLETGS